MKVADKHGSKIILANDPDADRLAIAEKMDGTWKIFNGNEIGALLGKWALDGYKQKLLKEGKSFSRLIIIWYIQFSSIISQTNYVLVGHFITT